MEQAIKEGRKNRLYSLQNGLKSLMGAFKPNPFLYVYYMFNNRPFSLKYLEKQKQNK